MFFHEFMDINIYKIISYSIHYFFFSFSLSHSHSLFSPFLLPSTDQNKAIADDMEAILTFFCKARSISYSSETQWAQLLYPLVAIGFPRGVAYNCFYAILNSYIPRNCDLDGLPFHVLRELVLYHDPEVCVMLDSRKISMEQFCLPWVSE